jgi:hypothetical protein
MAAQHERPAGYSTTVPRPAYRTVRRLQVLTCGTWSGDVARLRIRYIAIHGAFYEQFFPRCRTRAEAMLRQHGFRPLAADGAVTVWAAGP